MFDLYFNVQMLQVSSTGVVVQRSTCVVTCLCSWSKCTTTRPPRLCNADFFKKLRASNPSDHFTPRVFLMYLKFRYEYRLVTVDQTNQDLSSTVTRSENLARILKYFGDNNMASLEDVSTQHLCLID